MKYIITEQQIKTLEQIIWDYIDGHLTPLEGWESHEDYASELEVNGGELFFLITDDNEWDLNRDNHMWYSICDNDNLSEPLNEGHCPVVTLPAPVYQGLEGYFGDRWKKLFRRWFIMNTGLLVVKVDSQGF